MFRGVTLFSVSNTREAINESGCQDNSMVIYPTVYVVSTHMEIT